MVGRSLLSALAVMILLTIAVSPAWAITYGKLDGDGHPNVGIMVAELETPGVKEMICSGALIAPTVYLTAAHCTGYLASLGISDVWVSFDSEFIAGSTLIHGTMHTNPAFDQAQNDPGDIAVIVLDEPIVGVTPATLPRKGQFDRLERQGKLRGQRFTAVGYGSQERSNGGGPPTFGPTDTRMVAISTYRALNPTWLRLSQNPATGDGGTCYGDSGGPNLLGDSSLIAGLTVTGDTACRATNVIYRLDTVSARSFLVDFVPLP